MNEKTNELLPCPFCGSAAEIEDCRLTERGGERSGPASFAAGCANSNCISYQTFDEFARRSDAVAAWNVRSFSPLTQGFNEIFELAVKVCFLGRTACGVAGRDEGLCDGLGALESALEKYNHLTEKAKLK